MSGSAQQIVSSDYPAQYPLNTTLKWLVKSNQEIQLTFLFIDLEPSGECIYDFIEVEVKGNFYPRLCGMPSVPIVQIFYGGEIEITFHSDESETGSGFLASLDCGSLACQIAPTTINTMESTTPTTTMMPTPPIATIPASSTQLKTCTSENYPEPYNNNTDTTCSATAADPNSLIQIVFDNFNIEPVANCLYDYVNITEEVNGMTESILENTCGFAKPADRISQTPSISVNFHSDESETYGGFKLTLYEVPSTATVPPPAATSSIFCAGGLNDLDCCTTSYPCDYGQGDCDNDSQCAGSLRCTSARPHTPILSALIAKIQFSFFFGSLAVLVHSNITILVYSFGAFTDHSLAVLVH
jgi:hypothetical protein